MQCSGVATEASPSPCFASHTGCPSADGVQFTKPDHYKAFDKVADREGCCALCSAEPPGACGAWK